MYPSSSRRQRPVCGWCSARRSARSRPGHGRSSRTLSALADLPDEVAANRRCLSESTIRRLRGHADADRFDAVIGRVRAAPRTALAPPGRWRVLAVDSTTLRGSQLSAPSPPATSQARSVTQDCWFKSLRRNR
jgi:hypothetical protein